MRSDREAYRGSQNLFSRCRGCSLFAAAARDVADTMIDTHALQAGLPILVFAIGQVINVCKRNTVPLNSA